MGTSVRKQEEGGLQMGLRSAKLASGLSDNNSSHSNPDIAPEFGGGGGGLIRFGKDRPDWAAIRSDRPADGRV